MAVVIVGETPRLGDVPRMELADWRSAHGVVAGITTRGPGPAPGFDLGLWTREPVAETMGRWRSFRRALPEFGGLALAHQVHGREILVHDQLSGWATFEGADGHATALRGALLLVTVADCIPVYILDPVRHVIALLHAGWRGTAAGILPRALTMLTTRFGCSVENIVVHCGVGISGDRYEVGFEVFEGLGLAVPEAGKGKVDLRAVLSAQAAAAGVENVSVSSWCSARDAGHFFSHRRSGGADGRMVAYLGMLPPTAVDARD